MITRLKLFWSNLMFNRSMNELERTVWKGLRDGNSRIRLFNLGGITSKYPSKILQEVKRMALYDSDPEVREKAAEMSKYLQTQHLD